MKSVNVVIIRWKMGTEKIKVGHNDTIWTLIKYMTDKFNIEEDIQTLTQERTKTVIQKRAKLSSLDIENGEIFIMQIPSDSNSSIDKTLSNQNNTNTQSSSNVVTLEQLQAVHPTIKYQKYQDLTLKRVLFPMQEMARIGKISNSLHFNSTQVFFLYGTQPNNAAMRIHAVSLPSQECSNNSFQVNETHIKDSHHVAQICGLKFLGYLIIAPKTESIVAPSLFIRLIGLIPQDINEIIILRSLSTLKSMVDSVSCEMDAFYVNKQFIDLYRAGVFTGETTDKCLITKETVNAGTKITKEVEIPFFVTPIAIKYKNGWFPTNSFPYQCFYPTVADFVNQAYKYFDVPDYIRYLDFNFLLYLCTILSREDEVPLFVRKCIEKESVPDSILVKMEDMVDAPLRKLMR